MLQFSDTNWKYKTVSSNAYCLGELPVHILFKNSYYSRLKKQSYTWITFVIYVRWSLRNVIRCLLWLIICQPRIGGSTLIADVTQWTSFQLPLKSLHAKAYIIIVRITVPKSDQSLEMIIAEQRRPKSMIIVALAEYSSSFTITCPLQIVRFFWRFFYCQAVQQLSSWITLYNLDSNNVAV